MAVPCVLDGSGEQPLHVDAEFGVRTVCIVGLVLKGVTGTRFVAGTHRAELLRNNGGPGLFYMNEPRYMQQSVVVHDFVVVWDSKALHGGPSRAVARNRIMLWYTVVMAPLSPSQLAHVAEVGPTMNCTFHVPPCS